MSDEPKKRGKDPEFMKMMRQKAAEKKAEQRKIKDAQKLKEKKEYESKLKEADSQGSTCESASIREDSMMCTLHEMFAVSSHGTRYLPEPMEKTDSLDMLICRHIMGYQHPETFCDSPGGYGDGRAIPITLQKLPVLSLHLLSPPVQ